MEEESQDSDVRDVSDGPASDVAEADLDSDPDSDVWDSEGSEGAGWFADPDVEGQERYYDGSEWTSETRSVESDAPVSHLPDHAGELQRALAAATSDIDDVEDRLGTLFDRAEQVGERGGRARKQADAEAAGRAAEGRALADSVSQDAAHADAEGADEDDSMWEFTDEEDDDAIPELDEDLATEEPEKVKKGLFRRRS